MIKSKKVSALQDSMRPRSGPRGWSCRGLGLALDNSNLQVISCMRRLHQFKYPQTCPTLPANFEACFSP